MIVSEGEQVIPDSIGKNVVEHCGRGAVKGRLALQSCLVEPPYHKRKLSPTGKKTDMMMIKVASCCVQRR